MEINTNNSKVKIDLIKPNSYNPKVNFRENTHNFVEYEKVKKSLEKFGQVEPILVRELEDNTYEIVNGYHRYEAIKELGGEEIEIKNLGKISFDEAVAIALQTEETKIPIDNIELSGLIKSLISEEKNIEYWAELLPYTAEVIQNKLELVDFNFDQFNKESEGEEKLNKEDGESFSFKIKDEQEAEMCGKALNLASNDKNEAFVEICRSYVQMIEIGVDSDNE